MRYLCKTSFPLFAIGFILVVLLNPEFAAISTLYWGSILICFVAFLWLVFPVVKLNCYIKWRIALIIWAVLSYIVLASKLNMGYAFMMDVLLQSLPLFTCAVFIEKYDKSKEVIQVFTFSAFTTCIYACLKSGLSNFMVITLGYYTLGTQRWNSNFLGCLATYGFIFVLIYKRMPGKTFFDNRLVKLLFYITFTATVLWSGSRTALIVLVAGACGYYIITAENQLQTLKRILITFGIIVALYIAIMRVPSLYNIIGNRMERLFSFVSTGTAGELSIGWRQQMIEYGKELFRRHPIFGVGIDTFRYFYGIEGTTTFHSTYSHNNYIEVLADGGIVGFIIYYSIYFFGLRKVLKNRSGINMCFVLVLLVMLVGDCSTVSYQTLGCQMALCLSVVILNKSRTQI